MKYRKLGNTDIDLSIIGLGSMTWGEQNDQAQSFAQMDRAFEGGVNFLDLAEMYPIPPRPETQGASEAIAGNWMAERANRDQVFLATKVTGRGCHNRALEHIRGEARLSRDHIVEALEGSLRRLRTDYVDLYQVHWPERSTNFFGRLGYSHSEDDGIEIAETLSALSDLVKQGKIRYIGISNETPWGVMEYLRLAREQDLPRIVSIQNPYNLLNRSFEVGLAEMSLRENISLLAYSPLAFGKLSGKYLHGQQPAGARLTLFDRFKRYDKVNCESAIEAYVRLAQEHGLDPAQMALAFVNSRRFVTSNIIGVTNQEQLDVALNSVQLELSEEVLQGIDAIHNQYPNPAP